MSPKLLWNGLPSTHTHFRSTPLLCLTCPLILNFFNPPIFFNPTLHTPSITGGFKLWPRHIRIFQIALRTEIPPVGGIRSFAGGVILLGGLKLRRSDFDYLNLFPSYKELSVNTEHQLKSKLALPVCTKSIKLNLKWCSSIDYS